jgi:hypothetical protein
MSAPAERSRGEQYARIFRRAGVFAGKGNLAAAIDILQQGIVLARGLGDATMERVFADQIETHRREQTPG